MDIQEVGRDVWTGLAWIGDFQGEIAKQVILSVLNFAKKIYQVQF